MKPNWIKNLGNTVQPGLGKSVWTWPWLWSLVSALLLLTAGAAQSQPSVGAKFAIASGWAAAGAASDGTNFLVALQSDTGNAMVAAQLMSPVGAKIGAPIALGHAGQSCCAAGAAFDGANYLLAWEEDQGIKNSWAPLTVYGQFINPSGTKVGAAFALTSAGISLDGAHMLAYGGGKYLLTYTRLINPANGDASNNRYVAGRIIGSDGTMGNEFRISQGFGNGSSVTFNGASGENFFVVWKEDSLDQEVRGRFVTPAGVALAEISINTSAAPSDNPISVSFDGTHYLVAWSDQNPGGWDVYAQRISVADGSHVGGVITVSNEPGSQVATSITFDGSNHLVTWIDMQNDINGNAVCDSGEGSCLDIYGQYIGKDGTLIGGKFAISTDPGNQIGGVGCEVGKCLALLSNGVVMGQGGPAQVGDVVGALVSVGPVAGLGPHSASGSYTWNSVTGDLVLNITSSDFICEGPKLGSKTTSGVSITATAMIWPNDSNMTWTRPSGTAGDAVGSWAGSDSSTGNVYTLGLNADGTASVSGVIVACGSGGGSGGNGAKAEAQHWPDGYHVQLRYSDPGKAASAVSVSGSGIAGAVALTYNSNMGSWGSGTPESRLFLGTSYPTGLPLDYIFTITDTTVWTATSTVSCFQQQFVTSVSPVGSLSGNPTFSWTGIADANAVYGVQVNDSSGKWLWANYAVAGSSIAYNGPALSSGMTYDYVVSVQSSSACNNPTSGGGSYVAASFTYNPSGGVGPFDGDYVGTWGKTCPNCGITASTGTFAATLTNGVFSGVQFALTSGDSGIRLDSGASSASGVITATGATPDQCSSSVSSFTGQITSSTNSTDLTMTYTRPASNSCAAESGTIVATRAGATLRSVSLIPGWNLVGNSINAAMNVTSNLDDPAKVTSVWKWMPAASKWAFYTPSMTAANLGTFAASKGYDVLATINAGEGFWVNAKATFAVSLPAGTAVTANSFQNQLTPPNPLPAGWSLISMGDNKSPSAFNKAISAVPPAAGVIPNNLTSLWAWDPSLASWYFYAPSLEAQGGTHLTDYISSKAYLDFTAHGKMLGVGTGFWVNKPGQ